MDVPSPSYQQIAQMDAFVQAIRTNTKPEASGEEGLKDLKIIASILQAAETGRKITIT